MLVVVLRVMASVYFSNCVEDSVLLRTPWTKRVEPSTDLSRTQTVISIGRSEGWGHLKLVGVMELDVFVCRAVWTQFCRNILEQSLYYDRSLVLGGFAS